MSPILSDLDREPTEAASACSELLVPKDGPKHRLGPLTRLERRLLSRSLRFSWGSLTAWTLFIALLSAWYGR